MWGGGGYLLLFLGGIENFLSDVEIFSRGLRIFFWGGGGRLRIFFSGGGFDMFSGGLRN